MTTAINSSTAAKAFLGHGKRKLSFTELVKIINQKKIGVSTDGTK